MNKLTSWVERHKALSAIVLVVCLLQFLNFTGFCYGSFRYLDEQTVIDRYLFGKEASTLTFEEKVQKMKERGAEYPNCCRIADVSDESTIDKILNRLFGRYFYYVEFNYLPEKTYEKISVYRQKYEVVNACATYSIDSFGESQDKKDYESNIQKIIKHRKEKGYDD